MGETKTITPLEEHVSQETFSSFQRRHGDYVVLDIREDGPGATAWNVVYEDGATSTGDPKKGYLVSFGGSEPPADEEQRLTNIKRYLAGKRDQLRSQRERFYQDCCSRAHDLEQYAGYNPIPMPPNWEDKLISLSKEIDELDSKLHDVEKQLASQPVPTEVVEHNRLVREKREQAQDIIQRLNELR